MRDYFTLNLRAPLIILSESESIFPFIWNLIIPERYLYLNRWVAPCGERAEHCDPTAFIYRSLETSADGDDI